MGGYLVAGRSAAPSVAPQQCALTVPLIANTRSGPPWRRHRHALLPAGEIPGGHSFLVWNQRSGEMFNWRRADNPGAAPRFLVPTRYAEVLNRGWRDDAWSYCLVLGPEPPRRLDRNGFSTSTVIKPTTVQPGDSVTATVTVTAERSATVSIMVSIVAPDGTTPVKDALVDQQLGAGTPVSYHVGLYVPPDAATGVYVVKVGIFGPGRQSLLHWNDGTAVFLVGGQGGATTSGQ
jgi:hypothetical protein